MQKKGLYLFKNSSILVMMLISFLFIGCATIPELRVTTTKIPLKAIVYFSTDFKNTVVKTGFLDLYAGPFSVGESSIDYFKKSFSQLFYEIEFIYEKPSIKNDQILILPQITYAKRYPASQPGVAIEYNLKIFNSTGHILYEGGANGTANTNNAAAVIFGNTREIRNAFGKAQVDAINKIVQNLSSSRELIAYARKSRDANEFPSPQHTKEPTNYASNTPVSKEVIPSPETSIEIPEKEKKLVSLKVAPPETEKDKGDNLPSIQFGRYHALIIGNNDYKYLPKLKTAKNDSQIVANILQNDYGFNVTLLHNATRSDILLSLSKLRESLSNQDNLLIYYAGHGWLDKEGDEGYWLPVDATNDNEINWISNTSITTQLKAMEAKHVLIVSDSCYSGKLGRSVLIQRRTPDYYSRLANKRARIVIASGGLEPIIDSGGKGNHSVFASAFIEALQENQSFIDTSDLFNKIRRPVMLNADQTPEYADIRKAGHDGGEFVFIRKR